MEHVDDLRNAIQSYIIVKPYEDMAENYVIVGYRMFSGQRFYLVLRLSVS